MTDLRCGSSPVGPCAVGMQKQNMERHRERERGLQICYTATPPPNGTVLFSMILVVAICMVYVVVMRMQTSGVAQMQTNLWCGRRWKTTRHGNFDMHNLPFRKWRIADGKAERLFCLHENG